jgi:hypothetical protein
MLDELIRFAETVVVFSADFDDFIRKMLPEDTALIETLATHEFTAGHLESAHHGLEREVCKLENIIEVYKNGTLDELIGKAYLAKAIGILALRCHDAENEAPIV